MKKGTVVNQSVVDLFEIVKSHAKEGEPYGFKVCKNYAEVTDTFMMVRLSYSEKNASDIFPDLKPFEENDEAWLSAPTIQHIKNVTKQNKNNHIIITQEENNNNIIVLFEDNFIDIKEHTKQKRLYEPNFLDDKLKEIKENGKEIKINGNLLILLVKTILKCLKKDTPLTITVSEKMLSIEASEEYEDKKIKSILMGML